MIKKLLQLTVLMAVVFSSYPKLAWAAIGQEEWNGLISRTDKLIASGKAEQGLELWRAQIKKSPKDPAVLATYAEYNMKLSVAAELDKDHKGADRYAKESEKNYLSALKYFKRGKDDAHIIMANYWLGEINLYVWGDLDKAYTYYKKAYAIDPKSEVAITGMNHYGAVKMNRIVHGVKAPPKAYSALDSARQAASSAVEKAKATVQKTSASLRPETAMTHKVFLKNGQSMDMAIVERDANGFWFEAGPGARSYVKNSEVSRIVELGTSKTEEIPAPAPAAAVSAPSLPSSRACTQADLIGDWDKVAVLKSSGNEADHERMRFLKDGFVQHSQGFGELSETVVQASFDSIPPSVKYSVASGGRMTWLYPDFPTPGQIDSSVFTAAGVIGSTEVRAGDLKLVRYGADGKTPMDEIVLRRRG